MKKSRLILSAVLIVPTLLWAQPATVTARLQLVRAGGKPTKASGAVLWLTPVDESAAPTPNLPQGLRIVQHGKRFEPHLLVVPVGSTVEFPNRDPFFHNVFSLFDGRRFDLGLYEAGGTRHVHFDRAGISYIFCNIHSEMSAVIVALPTPYYGVSTASGEIAIQNVPAGRYMLQVWHEASSPDALKKLTREVVIAPDRISLGTLQLIDDGHLLLGHKNMYGQDYNTPPTGPTYSH